MIIKPKAYQFVLLTLLVSCAGEDNYPQGDKLPIEIEETEKLDSFKNTALLDTTIVEGTEFDENCESHFSSAMNQDKPDDLIIVHCEYWSSAHPVWLEHSYRFEFENNELFFEDVLDYNKMVPINDNTVLEEQQSNWFLPKDIVNYEGYYTEDDFDDFQLFRDLKTGHIFIRGSQY